MIRATLVEVVAWSLVIAAVPVVVLALGGAR